MKISFLTALSVLFVASCTPISPPDVPAEKTTPDASTAPQTAGATEDQGVTPALLLAGDVAELTAGLWKRQEAEAAEVDLRVRIRVDKKPVSLLARGGTISVLEGPDGAAAADMTVDLSSDQARAVIDGETTLAKLIRAEAVETDNAQGLARFVQFLSE
jgi:hypothetical protein